MQNISHPPAFIHSTAANPELPGAPEVLLCVAVGLVLKGCGTQLFYGPEDIKLRFTQCVSLDWYAA